MCYISTSVLLADEYKNTRQFSSFATNSLGTCPLTTEIEMRLDIFSLPFTTKILNVLKPNFLCISLGRDGLVPPGRAYKGVTGVLYPITLGAQGTLKM